MSTRGHSKNFMHVLHAATNGRKVLKVPRKPEPKTVYFFTLLLADFWKKTGQRKIAAAASSIPGVRDFGTNFPIPDKKSISRLFAQVYTSSSRDDTT